jgi:hypothetical protein
VKDIAEEMLDILSGEEKWTQRQYYCYEWNGKESRCLLGAYGQVTHDDASYYSDRDARTVYARRLRDVISEQYSERTDGFSEPGVVIVQFNDHPDTTFEDIRIVLEKAR